MEEMERQDAGVGGHLPMVSHYLCPLCPATLDTGRSYVERAGDRTSINV